MSWLDAFKQLVYDYAGLLLDGTVAEQRLQQHLQQMQQQLGLDTEHLLKHLQQSRPELNNLISQLTVNETYFFREPEQINLFVQQVLPQLLSLAEKRPLRILSAGCSSGEEPYSLAMAILEAHGEQTLERIAIDAGDVDLNILAKAREAIYSAFSFRGMQDEIRNHYFSAEGQAYRLHEHIRTHVQFFPLNLKDADYPAERGLYDAIFFRNVSIYFDEHTRQNIQHRFNRIMQPEAVLFLGTAETMANDFGLFSLCESHGLYYFAKGTQLQPAAPERLAHSADNHSHARQPPPPAVAPPKQRPATPAVSTPLPDLQLIRQLLHEERYDEAGSKLQLLLTAGQHKPEAQLMQAWLQLNKGDLAAAGRQLDSILQSDPWCLDALLARGLCSKWQADHNSAAKQFKTACYAHADSWLAHYFYGDILRLSNQPQIARGPLQVARRILSTSLEADTGCRWLPLAPAPLDALLLIERQLLGLKPGHMPHTEAET